MPCIQWTAVDHALSLVEQNTQCRPRTTYSRCTVHNAERSAERYDRSHASTMPRSPNWRSSRSNSRSWSTVLKAAVRSSRQRADIWPLSAATSRSLNTFVTAISVLWNQRYAGCILGISPLLLKKAWIHTWTIFSSCLEINDKLDTGRKFFSSLLSSLFFFRSGRTTACLNSVGKQPVSKDLLSSRVGKGDNKSHISFTSYEGAGSSWHVLLNTDLIIIIQTFVRRTLSASELNLRRRQLLNFIHGYRGPFTEHWRSSMYTEHCTVVLSRRWNLNCLNLVTVEDRKAVVWVRCQKWAALPKHLEMSATVSMSPLLAEVSRHQLWLFFPSYNRRITLSAKLVCHHQTASSEIACLLLSLGVVPVRRDSLRGTTALTAWLCDVP